jgi:hypothetical protein
MREFDHINLRSKCFLIYIFLGIFVSLMVIHKESHSHHKNKPTWARDMGSDIMKLNMNSTCYETIIKSWNKTSEDISV